MNDPSQMMNRSFPIWPPLHPPPEDPMAVFQNPRPVFAAAAGAKPGRVNWKGRKTANNRKKATTNAAMAGGSGVIPNIGAGGGVSGYKPPALNELQSQNRAKARRFYPKKKFTRFAPFAPRNTTSFIIRAKKSGGIASLVSPCPVTPAILPTPKFSPSREGLVDMAKEEWGVDGYGSMKGLIRLRSPAGVDTRGPGGAEDGDEEGEDNGSSESDVEEHLEVERRLDHDLSRFEMVYPTHGDETAAYLLENRVDDQDTHIAQLEEENLTLKERLFLMEQEIGELRRRLQLLENECHREREDYYHNSINEDGSNADNNNNHSANNIAEAGEEGLENDGGGDVCSEKCIGDYCEEGDGNGAIPMRE